MTSEFIAGRLHACSRGLQTLSIHAEDIVIRAMELRSDGNPSNRFDSDAWSTLGCTSRGRQYMHCAAVTTLVCLRLHRWLECSSSACVPLGAGFKRLEAFAEELQAWASGPLCMYNKQLLEECIALTRSFTAVVADDAAGRVAGMLPGMMSNAAALAWEMQRVHDEGLLPLRMLEERAAAVRITARDLSDDFRRVADGVAELDDQFDEAAREGNSVLAAGGMNPPLDVALLNKVESWHPERVLAKGLRTAVVEYMYARGGPLPE